jgi:sulfonate transport system substrate-binding protein
MGAMLAACARVRSRAPLRIGYQKDGLLPLSKARGTLAARLASAEVAEVNWAEFGSGPPLLEAMRAGAVDVGAVGDAPPIFAEAAGAPLLYAAAQPVTGAGQGLIVPKDSPLRSLVELKGRRIAFVRGSSAHLFVVEALALAGLNPREVTPVHLSPADASAAFSGGALDAWAVWDPFLALAEAQQGARLLVDGRRVAPTANFYVVTRAFAERWPAQLTALLRALAEDAAWANANTPAVLSLLEAKTDLPRAIMATSLRRGPFAVSPLTATIIAAQQAAADLLFEIGEIPAAVDVRRSVWSGSWA